MLSFAQFVAEAGPANLEPKTAYHYFKMNGRGLHGIGVALRRGANTNMHQALHNMYAIPWQELPAGYKPENVIGKVRIGQSGGSSVNNPTRFTGSSLAVHKDYQRQGVASGLYSHIEDELRHKLSPEGLQTQSGKDFWANRKTMQKEEAPTSAAKIFWVHHTQR